MWDKLKQSEFTTFRFPRKDRDLKVGEQVQVYYKNRTPQREKLGEAVITLIEPRYLSEITNLEAKIDGFADYMDMMRWLTSIYPDRILLTRQPMNKLTLKWLTSNEGG